MKIKNRLFGFSTKHLYLAELKTKVSYKKSDGEYYGERSFFPKKYVLVRKYEYDSYRDIFTKNDYNMKYSYYYPPDGTIIVRNLKPIVSNRNRIKYKDAEEILKTKNTVYIKN